MNDSDKNAKFSASLAAFRQLEEIVNGMEIPSSIDLVLPNSSFQFKLDRNEYLRGQARLIVAEFTEQLDEKTNLELERLRDSYHIPPQTLKVSQTYSFGP